jgi:importin subunit alpha-1
MIEKITSYAMDASWIVKKEAIWTLSNIFVTGTDQHTMALVQFESLQPLAKVLSLENADQKVLCAALDGIERVLEVSERYNNLTFERIFAEYSGIEYLENLQEHPSDEVYNKTIKIIETYFQSEEQEDENLVPETTDDGTFGFGAPSPKQLFTDEPGRPAFEFSGQVSNRN